MVLPQPATTTFVFVRSVRKHFLALKVELFVHIIFIYYKFRPFAFLHCNFMILSPSCLSPSLLATCLSNIFPYCVPILCKVFCLFCLLGLCFYLGLKKLMFCTMIEIISQIAAVNDYTKQQHKKPVLNLGPQK